MLQFGSNNLPKFYLPIIYSKGKGVASFQRSLSRNLITCHNSFEFNYYKQAMPSHNYNNK